MLPNIALMRKAGHIYALPLVRLFLVQVEPVKTSWQTVVSISAAVAQQFVAFFVIAD